MPDTIPYSLKMALSSFVQDGQQDRIMTQAITEISDDIMAVVKKYHESDMPIVLSVTKSIVNTLQGVLTPEGKVLMDEVSKRTRCTAIDVGAIKKMKEDLNND